MRFSRAGARFRSYTCPSLALTKVAAVTHEFGALKSWVPVKPVKGPAPPADEVSDDDELGKGFAAAFGNGRGRRDGRVPLPFARLFAPRERPQPPHHKGPSRRAPPQRFYSSHQRGAGMLWGSRPRLKGLPVLCNRV